MARLVVVSSPPLADGFRLARPGPAVARPGPEAVTALRRVVDEGDVGLVLVTADLWASVDERLRGTLERLPRPIVLSLPAGGGARFPAPPPDARRDAPAGDRLPHRAVRRELAMTIVEGRITAASGPVVRAAGLARATVGGGVRGAPVAPSGAPLHAWLGPGLLGATFDGLQRPLDRLAADGTWLLLPGRAAAAFERRGAGLAGPRLALGPDRRCSFEPERSAGDELGPGARLGSVPEGPIRHGI